MQYDRLLVAIPIPSEGPVADELARLQQELGPFAGKTHARGSMHVTVRFLRRPGNPYTPEEAEAVRAALERVAFDPFPLRLASVRFLGKNALAAVFADQDGGFAELVAAIERVLPPGIAVDGVQTEPHVTIARPNAQRGDNLAVLRQSLENCVVNPVSLTVTGFVFEGKPTGQTEYTRLAAVAGKH